MSRVNKIDFYCGAFLSYLITNKVEPTLFDASEKSKVVAFTLRDKEYNAYIKYSSNGSQKTKGKIESTKWDIIFTLKEKDYLYDQFYKDNKTNIVVLICANSNFKNTYFAVLSFDEARRCIGTDNTNNQFRISVKHNKFSNYSECYGTALSDINSIKIKYNFDDYFGFTN